MSPHKEALGDPPHAEPGDPALRETLRSRLEQVRERICRAEQASGRRPGSVTLLGAGKAQPVEAMRILAGLGQHRFGENYVQEALTKMEALSDLDIEWHFIGALQANKTRAVATRFSWAHTVDRARIARRLNDQRPPGLPPLNVCLEVNIDREASKSGVPPAQVAELARQVAELPRLKLRGLMSIPALRDTPASQREPYRRLRALLDELRERGVDLDTLSIGMSADLEAAVAEGATMVRIGTALFGPRPGGD